MGPWERERERFAAIVLADPNADFRRGLVEGRRLTLDQAVEVALSDA